MSTPAGAATTRRRTMGPALLGAVASGALLAVAGDRPWRSVAGAPEPAQGAAPPVATGLELAVANPAVTALALVCLAALGVVLVTRGRVRRVLAGLALVAALATGAAVAVAWATTADRVAAEVADGPLDGAATSPTGWAWAAVPAAVVLIGACVLAVRDAGAWPEMGRRYDAPAGSSAGSAGAALPDKPPAEQTPLELWRSIDEGRDPTTDERH